MTVKEMIKKLSKLDPKLEVEIEIGDDRWFTDGMKIGETWYNNPSNRYALLDLRVNADGISK
jgi:hypothetical protein